MLRRNISVLFLLLILLSIVGCQKSSKSGKETGSGNSNISNQKLDLKIHMHYGNSIIFSDDWPIFKKAAELTNVYLHGTATQSATDSQQVFGIMMASNELPDIIHGTKQNINRYALEGAFQELDELIEKYAPDIKKFIDENPEYKKSALASDGKMYFLPYMFEGAVSEGFFVRKDWLDKLNISIPKTVDEYYEMLKAFKTKDPNGNNKNDE
jgi:putative aldouronate transport system substrate-binding protein